MKKMFAMLLALLMLCAGIPAWAAEGEATITFETNEYSGRRKCTYTFPDGGVLYFGEDRALINDEWVEISPYWTLYESENLQGDVVIPDTIDGKPVEELFYESDRTDIHECLAHNPEMTSVTFPSTLKTVRSTYDFFETASMFFQGCHKLEEIIFPGDGPEDLGDGFFAEARGLKYVKLPKNILYLSRPFVGRSIDKVDLDPENPYFTMDGQGIIYTKDMTTVVTAMQGASERTSATLPDSVAKITAYAFSSNVKLEKVYGGAADMQADKNAFFGCTALNPFRDSYGHWSEESVKWAYQEGILKGVTEIQFSVNKPLERGMFCTALYRMSKEGAAVGTNFSDVASGAYYEEAVAWAEANGVVKGYADGTFRPKNRVTREQMAAFLYRYAKEKGIEGESASLDDFADAGSVSSYAKDAMGWAVGSGLLKGKNGNRLDPQGQATRAEAAAVLQRLAGME